MIPDRVDYHTEILSHLARLPEGRQYVTSVVVHMCLFHHTLNFDGGGNDSWAGNHRPGEKLWLASRAGLQPRNSYRL